VSTRRAVLEVLAGANTYQTLPTAYKSGIVARHVLTGLRSRNGRLFRSRSPDAYLGFAVADSLPHYGVVGRPMMVSGTSVVSTGWNTLGGGETQAPAAREFFALGALSPVELHPEIAAVDGSLPRSLQLMTLEAYLQTERRGSLPERVLASRIVQIIVMLGGERQVGDEAILWSQRFLGAGRSRISAGVLWWVARRLARAVPLSYRIANRLKRRRIPRGLEPVTTISEQESDGMIRRARGAYGVKLAPAPTTLHEAVVLLDRALYADRETASARTDVRGRPARRGSRRHHDS
jgi:hypothetical protein